MKRACVIVRPKPGQNKIKSAFFQPADQSNGRCYFDSRLYFRSLLAHHGQGWHQGPNGGSGDGTDAHGAGKAGAQLFNLAVQRVDLGKNDTCATHKGRPGRGRDHAARQAVEQRSPGIGLDIRKQP